MSELESEEELEREVDTTRSMLEVFGEYEPFNASSEETEDSENDCVCDAAMDI